MIQKLEAINIPQSVEMKLGSSHPYFVLETCQRGFLLGFNLTETLPHIEDILSSEEDHPGLIHYRGGESYRAALEILCGLKSRLVGENEIVKQYKEAFQQFLSKNNRDKRLIPVLEKLLKDAKEVRSEHLNKVGQYSYAGLTKYLLTRTCPGGKVVIVGSGNLCEDLIKVLNRKFELVVCARNEEKVEGLKQRYDVQTLPWSELQNTFNYKAVVNTIGAEDTVLFNQDYFDTRLRHLASEASLFIDLGSPSVLNTTYGKREGIIRLEELFDLGEKLGKEKALKVQKAHDKIQSLVLKRKTHFTLSSSAIKPA